MLTDSRSIADDVYIFLGGVPAFVLATAGVDKKVKLWLAPKVISA